MRGACLRAFLAIDRRVNWYGGIGHHWNLFSIGIRLAGYPQSAEFTFDILGLRRTGVNLAVRVSINGPLSPAPAGFILVLGK